MADQVLDTIAVFFAHGLREFGGTLARRSYLSIKYLESVSWSGSNSQELVQKCTRCHSGTKGGECPGSTTSRMDASAAVPSRTYHQRVIDVVIALVTVYIMFADASL